MAVSVEERKRDIKGKRSSAVKQKIDLLKTRDGSSAPPIDSLKDVDDFNLSMLFGSSRNKNIDWEHMGVEGLMRAYYYIVQKLTGPRRNNIITDTSGSGTINSGIQSAVDLLFDGRAYNSGFFIGNSSSSDAVKNRANRGEFDLGSSSFNQNREQSGGEWPYDANNLSAKIQDAINLIGQPSPIGNKDNSGQSTSFSEALDLGWIDKYDDGVGTIRGMRYTDVCPQQYTPSWGDPPSPATWDYGDGIRDEDGQNDGISGFTADRDYYDADLTSKLDYIKSLCDTVIQYINYCKVSDETYFINPSVIPGYDDGWTDQDAWIDQLEQIKTDIDDYYATIAPYYSGGNSTDSGATLIKPDPGDSDTWYWTYPGRGVVDSALEDLQSALGSHKSWVNSISNTIHGDSFQGDVEDPSTMRGYRFLWVKAIIDATDGSRVAIEGIGTALKQVNKTITTAEEGFGLFGITKSTDPKLGKTAWIGGLPTPDIVGIETYATIDSDSTSPTFGEMIITGYIIAWDGPGHSVGYDLYKSNDWDGSTGTWTHILPAGNLYSIEDIDLNNGKVLTYYIDTDVDPNDGEKPYYKVIAYDNGGSGDYSRIAGVSEECDPKNIDDFSAVASTTPFVGPSGPPPSPPDEAPAYLFKWTTVKAGSESSDNPINKTFTSEAAFDSIGSNLEVFVDGIQVNQGTAPDQYQISGNQDVVFNSSIDNNSEVAMIVYFGGGSGGGEGGGWKPPVETANLLPNVGNSPGDIRLVIEEETLYMWDEDFETWTSVKSDTSSTITHGQLHDMPDESGVNSDHDERYYTRNEMNEELDEINSQIAALQSLLPDDAQPLSGELGVSGGQFKSGYMSQGSHNFFDTLQPHNYFNKLIRDVNFQLTNPDPETMLSDADKGVLYVYLNGTLADEFNLEQAFEEQYRASAQVYPPQFGNGNVLEIVSVSPHNNYPNYQKCDFRIHISGSRLLAGENEVKIHHQLPEETREASVLFFYDDESQGITFDSIFVDESLIKSSSYLSGIRHYTLGDKLRIRFFMYRMFNNTYVLDDQIQVNPTQLGCSEYSDNWQSPYVTNVVTGEIGEYLSYDRDSVLDITNVYNNEPVVKLKGKNPFSTYGEFVSDQTDPYVLINTYSDYSDDKHEYFVDEQYRLDHTINSNAVPSAYKNQWNSNAALTSGQLQVFGQQLIYPHENFTNSYIPEQTANYIGFSGARYYMRALIDVGIPHSNGKITIDNWDSSDPDVKIMIKLPSETGWLDLSKPYNEADFTGSDNDGCLVASNGYEYNFTSGVYSTADSGYMLLLRVEMNNASATPINSIHIDW